MASSGRQASMTGLRRGRWTVRLLRAVARLPEGHGIIWRVLVPFSPGPLRRIVCDPDGFIMNLDLTQLLDFEYALGTYDRAECEFLVSEYVAGTHFLDIGANQGFYSLFLASRRPGARMLCFEPDPYSLSKIRSNVAANGFSAITICPYALSDTDEPRSLLLVEERNRGSQSLLAEQAREGGPLGSLTVPCRTLLGALRENGVKSVSVLKIDVEGFEFPVLKKFFEEAPESLYPRSVIVEALGDRISVVGGSPIEILVSRGYRIVNHNRFNFLMRRGS